MIPNSQKSPVSQGSNTSIFSKIKNLIYAGIKHETIGEQRQVFTPKIRRSYRCQCGGDDSESYACSSAMRWLRDASNKGFNDEFDHKKSEILYQGLLKNKIASGSES
jgi:hypothetical protein